MSPGRNEHNKKHPATQKFGRDQICQIRRVMALRYILYVKNMYFSTFFSKKIAWHEYHFFLLNLNLNLNLVKIRIPGFGYFYNLQINYSIV
jgi:hypothetical protein